MAKTGTPPKEDYMVCYFCDRRPLDIADDLLYCAECERSYGHKRTGGGRSKND